MEQKTNYTQSSDIIRRVYYSIKSNWLLIGIILALSIAVGIVISYFQVPVYTATCKTIYKASMDNAMQSEGQGKYDNITLTNRYLTSVVDFCKQGCIADRANYYYNDYIENKKNYSDVKEYIKEIEAEYVASEMAYAEATTEGGVPYKKPIEDSEFFIKQDKYLKAITENENLLEELPQHIIMSNITIKQPDEESFVVNVSYTDEDINVVADKILLIYATINREAKVRTVVDGATFYKYFYNAEINLTNTTESPTPYNSVNRKKTVLIAMVVGAVVSLAAVYIENMFNRTIRSRSELESCTGAGFLAYIDDQGV